MGWARMIFTGARPSFLTESEARAGLWDTCNSPRSDQPSGGFAKGVRGLRSRAPAPHPMNMGGRNAARSLAHPASSKAMDCML